MDVVLSSGESAWLLLALAAAAAAAVCMRSWLMPGKLVLIAACSNNVTGVTVLSVRVSVVDTGGSLLIATLGYGETFDRRERQERKMPSCTFECQT